MSEDLCKLLRKKTYVTRKYELICELDYFAFVVYILLALIYKRGCDITCINRAGSGWLWESQREIEKSREPERENECGGETRSGIT